VSGSGGGTDSDGSTAGMVILPDGRQHTWGTEVTPGPPRSTRAFSVEAEPSSQAPRDLPKAELVRTATGAKLVVPPGEDLGTGGVGYFGAPGYHALEKPQAQHEAWSTFELTEQDLAAFGNLTRTRAISLKGEPDEQLGIGLTVQARLPDLGEVLVEAEGYDSWRPQPGR